MEQQPLLPFYSLNSLLVFYTVVELGSFSKAATMLSRTQPSISSHVAELELQVGMALLIRGHGKFEVTKEGKIVFRYASKILKMSKELEQILRNIQKVEKCLRVGTTPTYSRTLMPSLISGFQEAYPSVKIQLDVGGSEEMEKSLLSMQNDVVLIANPKHLSKVHAQLLGKEELLLITPKGHELSKEKWLSLATVTNYPLILRSEGSATRKTILSALNAMNLIPSTLVEAKSMDFICEFVSQGRGVAVVTESAARSRKQEVNIVHFQDPLFLNMYYVTLKSKKYDALLQKFMNYVSLSDLK